MALQFAFTLVSLSQMAGDQTNHPTFVASDEDNSRQQRLLRIMCSSEVASIARSPVPLVSLDGSPKLSGVSG